MLQGLKVLPWFILCLVIGLGYALLDLSPEGRLGYCGAIGIPGALLAGWLSRRIIRYYNHTFGQVRNPSTNIVVFLIVIGWAAAIGFPAVIFDLIGLIPISVTGLAIASLSLVTWLLSGRVLTHYWVMAAIVAGLSLLPVTGVLRPILIHQGGGDWHYVLLCTVLAVGSVLDHLVLVRNLKPIQEASDGGDV
jgi:hypothetical protein